MNNDLSTLSLWLLSTRSLIMASVSVALNAGILGQFNFFFLRHSLHYFIWTSLFCGKYLSKHVDKHITNKSTKSISVQLSESLSIITITQGSPFIFHLNIWMFFTFTYRFTSLLVHRLFDTLRPFWYCFSSSWGTSFSISFSVDILVIQCFWLSESSFSVHVLER